MPRYINADALPQKRYTDPNKLARSLADYMIAFDNGWNACIDEIGKQHTISPDEIRGVGKWIITRTWEHDGEPYCSKCGFEQSYTRFEKFNYCPNCGAKMEVSEDA